MKNNTIGFWYCVIAYTLWGIFPIYWKCLNNFDSLTILTHRIIWCLVFTFLLLAFAGRISELKSALLSKKNLVSLILRSIFVVSNWLIYVWAINDNRILECSLGYFICPLTAVLLGFIFLKEKLSKKTNYILNYCHTCCFKSDIQLRPFSMGINSNSTYFRVLRSAKKNSSCGISTRIIS